jgi:dTDP-glucose 4,6-dehydratase
VLVTGATGFFGTWLVAALLHADEKLDLGLRITASARNPAVLPARLAEHRAGALELLAEDVRAFSPRPAAWTHVLHCATPTSANVDPRTIFDVALEGTRRVLDATGSARVLFTSSGAVYGRQEVTHVAETCERGPDPLDPRSAYAEGKRAAELLCALAAAEGRPVTIARCFAFVGPHLPLDAHFAIGNFLRDALARRPIVVSGDGTPRRSYLYAGDLVEWLLAVLVRGKPGRAYNVGSDRDLSIAELANVIGDRFGAPVEVRGVSVPNAPIARYVPSVRRAREELGVEQRVTLEEALDRTAAWHSA